MLKKFKIYITVFLFVSTIVTFINYNQNQFSIGIQRRSRSSQYDIYK